MDKRDAAILHEVLTAERLTKAVGPEEEMLARWRRLCDSRRHERPLHGIDPEARHG